MGRFRKNERRESLPAEFLGYYEILDPQSGQWTRLPGDTYSGSYANQVVEGHYCLDELHPGPPFRIGGPFQQWDILEPRRKFSEDTVYENRVAGSGYRYRYRGRFCLTAPYTGVILPDSLTKVNTYWDVSGSNYGATGWNKCKPGKPGANLGQFLGEIKEVPKMLASTAFTYAKAWKSMRQSKHAANEFLNTQFGWFPFLSDLVAFYNTYTNLDKMLKQIIRDNGRFVRRHCTIRNDDSVTPSVVSETQHTYMLPTLLGTFYKNYPYGPYGKTVDTLFTGDYIWFEAAFRYWIPDIGSVHWNRRAKAVMFGLVLDPALLWELTPWSWLVDWISNAGDVFANMSNGLAENLAAKYAYVMRHKVKWVRRDSVAYLHDGDVKLSENYYFESKNRVGASPFGFGLTGMDFTSRQWSILTALGISRLKY